MVRGSGGIELAKSEETAAGMGSPLPLWLNLAPKQGPTRPGKGMGDGVAFLGLGQIGA